MKKFFFRLDALLRVRTTNELRLQKELGIHSQKLSELREKKGTLEGQISSLIEEMKKKREEGVREYEEMYAEILERLNLSLTQASSSLNIQENLIKELQMRLKRAAMERKVIEKIKEKQYSLWQKQALEEKGQELDEISSRRE